MFLKQKGANVRLDTTLVGMENTSWIRGLRSFIFIEKDGEMTFYEVDHDAKVVRSERSHVGHRQRKPGTDDTDSLPSVELLVPPTEEVLQQRMRTPVMLTNLDTNKIQFERCRTGLLWRSDKSEDISGYNCKVFSASNVTFVTRSRTEHLTDKDKVRRF